MRPRRFALVTTSIGLLLIHKPKRSFSGGPTLLGHRNGVMVKKVNILMMVMEKLENLMIVVEQQENGFVSGWSFKCSDERHWPWEIELLQISFHPHSTFILATSSTAASIMLLHCHILSPISPGTLFSVFLYWYIGILRIGTLEPLLCDTFSIQRTQDLVSEKRPHNLCICYLYLRNTSIIKGHKFWSQKNVQINFVSVTSIDTPLFRGEGHFSDSRNPDLTSIQGKP